MRRRGAAARKDTTREINVVAFYSVLAYLPLGAMLEPRKKENEQPQKRRERSNFFRLQGERGKSRVIQESSSSLEQLGDSCQQQASCSLSLSLPLLYTGTVKKDLSLSLRNNRTTQSSGSSITSSCTRSFLSPTEYIGPFCVCVAVVRTPHVGTCV